MAAIDQTAVDILKGQFEELGLADLWAVAMSIIAEEGYDGSSQSAFLTRIEATDQYKERFKANEIRRRNNLPALKPADYVQLEQSYKQLMFQSGLPEGFYDTNDDFVGWIGKDVAVTEVERRILMANESARQSNPEMRKALQDYYGIGPEGVVAYFLDAERAGDVLQKQFQAAQFGAAAARFGMSADLDVADMAVDAGVDDSEARRGFERVAEETPVITRLGDIYGEQVSQRENVEATFNIGSAAGTNAKKRRLASRERAAFSGSSAVSAGSLSRMDQV